MRILKLIFLFFFVSCISCDVSDSEVIDAIPEDVNTEAPVLIDEEKDSSRNEQVTYEGAQLLRVSYNEQQHKNAISEMQKRFKASMWNLHTANTSNAYVDLFLKKDNAEEAKDYLRKIHVPFNVMIDNIQDAINNENPPFDEIELWQNRDGHPMTWTAYHRFSDISLYLDYLTKSYPNLCSVRTIGRSILNRPLKVLRISNGVASNKAVWIDGGIHAREWISPAVATYLADSIILNFDSLSPEMRAIDWYILPVMNPDGYEYTFTKDRLWRKNLRGHTTFCKGVDLNRNYGHKWGGQGASRQPCSETYAGSKAFSEPETKAVHDFLQQSAANFKASLSFHSYGQYILYPWGYDRKVPADHQELDRVGKEAASAMKTIDKKSYTVGPAGSTLYPAAGGSDDWAKGDLKFKYSYTIELRDEGRYGFMLPADQIIKTGDESFEFLRVLAKAVARA